MARALSIPAARVAPNLTLLVWGGITLLGSLLLPWFREGRDLYTFLPEAVGLTLLSRSALIGAVAATALIAAAIGGIPRGNADRGRGARGGGGGGPGVPLPVFLAVLGTGLALAGILRCDAFLASSILWVSAFVVVFILFPLWTVLQASGFVQGRLTLAG